MKYYLVVLFFVSHSISFFGQNSITTILKKSSAYYETLTFKVFYVEIKSKNALNTDTNTLHTKMIFEKNDNSKIVKQIFFDNNKLSTIYYDDFRRYAVDSVLKTLYSDNTKSNSSFERLKYYPFWKPKFIYKELPRRIVDIRSKSWVKWSLDSSSVTAIIEDKNTKYELLFLRNGHIQKVMITTKSSYGVDFKELTFEESVNSELPVKSIFQELSDCKKQFRNISKKDILSMKSEKKYISVNSYINIDSLKYFLGLDSLSKKYLLLDVFHKSCLPCIKSIPLLNKCKELPNVIVFGLAPLKLDKGNWDDFIVRYSIKYRIIDFPLSGQIVNNVFGGYQFSYPSSLLIGSDGKIIFFQEGHTSNFYKKVRSIIMD